MELEYPSSRMLHTSHKLGIWFLSGITTTASLMALSATPLRQISFEGRTEATAKVASYRIKVGRTDPSRPAQPLLTVIQDPNGHRIAECQVRSFEKIRARIPKALHIECDSAPSPFLDRHLSLVWTKTGVQLQSGDWISGRKEIAIQVDRDLFSHPQFAEPEALQLAQNDARPSP